MGVDGSVGNTISYTQHCQKWLRDLQETSEGRKLDGTAQEGGSNVRICTFSAKIDIFQLSTTFHILASFWHPWGFVRHFWGFGRHAAQTTLGGKVVSRSWGDIYKRRFGPEFCRGWREFLAKTI
jgi:hypothetical protein